MNAPNASQTSLQAEQKAHEPSMEDILASIRRIIADDDALPLSRRASVRPEPAAREPARAQEPPGAQESPRTQEPPILQEPPLAAQPVSPPPVSDAPAPNPTVVAPPFFQTRSGAQMRPPPLPNLRDLALRLDDIPSSLAPPPASLAQPAHAEPAPLASDLRPSLGGLPEFVSARAAAELTAETAQPAPAVQPLVSSPAPQPAKQSVSFETGGVIPPFSFRASVPPSVVSLAPLHREPAQRTPLQAAPPPAPDPAIASVFASQPAPSVAAEAVAPAPVGPAPVASARQSGLPPARFDRIEPAMLSELNGVKVGAAFEALAESALLRDPEMVERLTREILRPIIKTWLDDNLPNVVERLVRAEIERVARGPKD